MSQELLAEQLGWSTAKVSRMETNKTTITEPDVAAFLAVLRITGDERDYLLKLSRELDQPAWWELHRGLPGQMRALIDAEQRATRIINVSTSYIYGLLQTRAYSRGIFEQGERSASEIEDAVAVRQSRQGVLDKANPVELTVFLDEATLLRPVGSSGTTAEQLRHITAVTGQDNINVRVLPLSVGAHKGLDGTFTLLEFQRGLPAINVEASNAGLMLDEPEDVAPFRRTLDKLNETAMREEESLQLIAAYAVEFEGESGCSTETQSSGGAHPATAGIKAPAWR